MPNTQGSFELGNDARRNRREYAEVISQRIPDLQRAIWTAHASQVKIVPSPAALREHAYSAQLAETRAQQSFMSNEFQGPLPQQAAPAEAAPAQPAVQQVPVVAEVAQPAATEPLNMLQEPDNPADQARAIIDALHADMQLEASRNPLFAATPVPPADATQEDYHLA